MCTSKVRKTINLYINIDSIEIQANYPKKFHTEYFLDNVDIASETSYLDDETYDEREDTNNENSGDFHNEQYFCDETDFQVLGTSMDDVISKRYILSQTLMKSLRLHMPYSVQQDNFELKYSLARDGASMMALLSKSSEAKRTILAIKTISGDVFGAFTSSSWFDNGNKYYGSYESFLWKLDQASGDNLKVYPWNGSNRNIQLSNTDKLILGGDESGSIRGGQRIYWGYGIALIDDLSRGSSNSCVTYESPSLVTNTAEEGGFFEIYDIEVWAMTNTDFVEQPKYSELARSSYFERI